MVEDPRDVMIANMLESLQGPIVNIDILPNQNRLSVDAHGWVSMYWLFIGLLIGITITVCYFACIGVKPRIPRPSSTFRYDFISFFLNKLTKFNFF